MTKQPNYQVRAKRVERTILLPSLRLVCVHFKEFCSLRRGACLPTAAARSFSCLFQPPVRA
jgi:hypothetical protein